MNDLERFSFYTRAYFTGGNPETITNMVDGILREDQFSAICYALGMFDPREFKLYKEDAEVFESYDQQLDMIRSAIPNRIPQRILSVGAGRGEMEYALQALGFDITALEPTEAGAQLIMENKDKWTRQSKGNFTLIHQTLLEFIKSCTPELFPYDTIIFCESIEHIPEEETQALFNLLQILDSPVRVIIVNVMSFHPINPDNTGWDHIRTIDDIYYDSLDDIALAIPHRQGSHFVGDF